MKKRLLAGFLSLITVLSLLPTTALASTGVAGVVNVYTLADLQSAVKDSSVTTIRLMNDIDAGKEHVSNYRSNDYTTVTDRLQKNVTLDGQGHTIYNLKTTLLQYNAGTIKNLNTTVHDTSEDSEHLVYHMTAQYSGAQINISGIAVQNLGTIESCNTRFTLEGERSQVDFRLSGITAYNSGTIRDCIASYDVDYHIKNGGAWLTGAASFNGLAYSNSGLIDHSLVLGSVIVSGDAYSSEAIGLTNMSTDGQCTNSACTLEQLSLTCNDEYDFSPAFQTYTGSTAGAKNCRVAADLQVTNISEEEDIHEGGTVSGGEGYTLASRADILKDWDTSKVPSETPSVPMPTPEPVPEPAEPSFSKGTVEFHFEGSCGDTRSWQFDYDDSFFYEQDDGYGYNAKLAKASLCLEMASFTTNAGSTWSGNGRSDPSIVFSRTENIRELLIELGFDSLEYMNYDVSLRDTSDKVAYSMAMKYITNETGGTDTLIAVPIRGGGYGGEWASNFRVYGNTNPLSSNHCGFQTAAEGVLNGLSDYVQSHEIKGDLKIWAVGFSRGAAVANLLGRMLNNAKLGGIKPNVADIYVYTFATPAGASRMSAETFYDPNIFNIVSPVDLVPHVAPGAWNYTRYGTTLTLPYDNNSALWNKFEEISGVKTSGIKPSQRTLIDRFCQKAFTSNPATGNGAFGKTSYSSIQQEIMNFTGDALGAPPSSSPDSPTSSTHDPIKTYKIIGTLRCVLSDAAMRKLLSYAALDNDTLLLEVIPKLSTIGLAHYPEHYLARLETDNLQDEDDFYTSTHARSVLMYPPADKQLKTYDIKVDFWNAGGQSAGSYASGVCKSGSVTVEMTDAGLVATFPAEGDYTFTVSGADAGKLAMTIYAYDDTELDPTRTMDFNSLPSKNGSACTVYVPEDPYDEFYAKDANGKAYIPDSDSEYPNRVNHPGFTDVPANAYFHDAVEWAVEEGITSGTTATTFSPYNACTRAQVVTFLWRAAGSPEPESSYNPFWDVPANAYYHDAVLWAAEEGITTGVTANRFNPNATVTRGQTVTFLWRWDGEPEAESRSMFRDVSAGAYYADAVSWAVEMGITNGTTASTFAPNQTCTRAQIVTFLYRDLRDVYEEDNEDYDNE